MINATNLIKSVLIGLFLFSICPSSAQNVHRFSLGNNGTSTTVTQNEKTYHVSQSIGQASMIGTIKSTGYIIGQGYQQPLHTIALAIPSNEGLNATVYPNPVETALSILVNEELLSSVNVFLHDITGLTIHNGLYNSFQAYQINMTPLKPGTYILKLRMGEKIFTARIVKK